MRIARAFAPILAANGGSASAKMLSVVSWFTPPTVATYTVSKHAALAVTDSMRIELKVQGTHVIAVHVASSTRTWQRILVNQVVASRCRMRDARFYSGRCEHGIGRRKESTISGADPSGLVRTEAASSKLGSSTRLQGLKPPGRTQR